MPRIVPAAVLDRPTLMANPAASRRLYQWGLAALVATCIWFISENRWEIDLQTLLGIAIMALASRPALSWANRNQRWFPTFEIAMLTCVPFYAIPLLSHHPELRYYPENIITQASSLVILYIVSASISFSLPKRPPKAHRLFTISLIPNISYHLIPWGIFLTNIHTAISTFTNIIPHEASRSIATLFFGIGTLSIFVSARLWGLGMMKTEQKLFFLANIALQIILLFSSLYLITGISIFALALISYSMSKRSVPWTTLLIFLPFISILHLGKSQMREIYWKENAIREKPSIDRILSFYTEWIGYGLQAERIERDTRVRQGTIFERASLMHMITLSVDRVPREIPHLNGETYLDIPAAIIPRFLWKNKPHTNLSTHRIGIYFGLVNSEDITKVAIAFGMLAEAYINFGILGVIGFGVISGLIFKRITLLAQNASQFSALGILSILLTAWSFQAESTASIWLSSLFQATVCCIGLPLGYHLAFSGKKT